MKLLLKENLKISLESIRSHTVRTFLTIAIIAFGIMALVGIFTAINSLKYFLQENFSILGANTFSIERQSNSLGRSAKVYKAISLLEATEFKKRFDFQAYTSVYTFGTSTATLKSETEKTNPNIQVVGIDENYVFNSGFEIEQGRNITAIEAQQGAHVTLLGSEIVKLLFKNNEDPIGQVITVATGRYRVVGVMKEKGSSMGYSGDRFCLIPFNNVRSYFSMPNMQYYVTVRVDDPQLIDSAINEATGLFRTIRGDRIGKENSFSIQKSDSIAQMMIELMSKITLGAVFIGLITLFGAAIGLMNIMLVSVTERTQEIGIRKAMGATKTVIKNQFLAEAVIIAIIGGLLGIVLGILAGNAMTFIIGSPFTVPWGWIIIAIILCFGVALASGIIPAKKAAELDPIESLRYE